MADTGYAAQTIERKIMEKVDGAFIKRKRLRVFLLSGKLCLLQIKHDFNRIYLLFLR